MKKILLMTLAAAMGAAFAEEAKTVTLVSQNTVGIMPVKRSASSTDMTVPIPFVRVGTGEDVTLAETLYAENLTMGDQVQICLDSAYGYFSVWTALGDLASMVGYDFRSQSRTENGVSITPPLATEQILPRGTGVALTTNADKVYVMGQYDAVRPKTKVLAGLRSYLANPTSESLALESKIPAGKADRRDLVQIPVKTLGGVMYIEYQFDVQGENGNHWFYETHNNNAVTRTYANPQLEPGVGFYYWRSARAGDLTIEW